MNFVTVCAQLNDTPREIYTSATSSNYVAEVTLPPVGKNKSATVLALNVYGKVVEKFRTLDRGARLYVHGSKIRYDIDAKAYSLHGGIIAVVNDSFPIFNDIILTGRCIKDIDQEDTRAFKTTAEGLMIANQTISVNTGRNQGDLFNFYAINSKDDKLNNAELMVNFTRKGTGLTIRGRLVTDSWTDKETQQRRTLTKIQLAQMTLAPKLGTGEPKSVASQTTVASSDNVATLWGGKTAEDSWSQTLSDLPGQYGPELTPASEFIPF
jgi:single-stranded DNA-binding protein